MDSSSDGSFAWTDASSDTIDSGAAMVNGNMSKLHSEDESVSGKSFKKKLQDELFAQSRGLVENDELKHKDRKRKLTEQQSESEHVSPKKKKIKREPESDIDVSATKFKTNGHNSEPHDSYDDSYLELKVKAEKQFASPDKKIKHRNKNVSNSDSLLEESSETINIKTKKKSKRYSCEESDVEDDKLNQLVQNEKECHEDDTDDNERKTKKKKKKSKNRKESQEEKKKKKHQESYTEEDEAAEEVAESNISSRVDTKINNTKNLSLSSSEGPGDCRVVDTDRLKQQLDPHANKSVSFNNILDESVKRTPRISERIQFEEDESSDVETSLLQSSKISTKSSKLKKFLKNMSNLKPFTSKLNNESILTANDEIWIVRCPKDVEINAFQNKDITLDGKCKLKLNGQTYEGIVDNESANMSILSSEQSNFVIKSLSVKGCLNLRKRIPKSHIHNEATTSSQTNFIPLPETKCRHPLFGSNYRKAIKLSASVAERLRTLASASEPAHTKKKRTHKERSTCQDTSDHSVGTPKAEPRPESEVKPEVETDHLVSSKKKKKKRLHLDSEDIVPKKKKRKKHDLESAEAWESEQAIEENLFNF